MEMKYLKNIQLYIVLVLCCTVISGNTSVNEALKDKLQTEINEWHTELLKSYKREYKDYSQKYIEQLSELKQTTRFPCTNGLNPYVLSKRAYLDQFAKGPCTPAIVLPGIMSSKLVASIDCEALKKGDPYTFKKCGWTGCSGAFNKIPKTEYQIWIPKIFSPSSIIKPYGNSKKCFAGLLGFKLEGAGSNLKIKPVPGIKISALGTTPRLGKKKDENLCGWSAIEKLLPIKSLEIAGTLLFKPMREIFVQAGYRIGVTLQALPYDYRLDVRENELNTKFKKVVDEMYEMLGKKITLISHSFGNHQVVNYLWNQSQAEKDKKISKYIALAPPLGGAIKPLASMIGMDSSYSKSLLIAKVGLIEEFFTRSIFMYKGLYNLFPGNHFESQRDKPYMKAILAKIAAEKGKTNPPKGTVMDMFPPFNSQCVVGFKKRPDNCNFNMNDMTEFGTILGKTVTYGNLFTKLVKYSHSENAPDILKASRDERYNELKNTGVQTNIIFSAAVPTHSKLHYNDNPRIKTNRGKIYDPDRIEMSPGDGSVLSTSSMLAGIKWADEFQFNRDPNAKPVTMIEVCSSYNQKSSIFQEGKKVVKNEYIGVDCSCKGTKLIRANAKKCADHVGLVEEPKIISFILNSMMDAQPGRVGGKFSTLSNTKLKEFEENCYLFNGWKRW